MAKKKHKLTKRNADRYDLYLKSVQEPSVEIEFFNRVYRKEFGRAPMLLREDFCGTAAVCAHWVKSKPDRRAIGIDLDPEPLAWSREHVLSRLKDEPRQRVSLIQADVRDIHPEKADVLAAQNFSFYGFMEREELRRYFEAARRNLDTQGLMVLDMMGGSEVMLEDHTDSTRKEGFTYHWEQKSFDPITHQASFAIHFSFRDGTKWKDAFTYDWRIWTIPEVREILREAGFSRTDVYWEGVDEDGEGDGVFRRREHGTADEAWICYVVAVR